MAKHPINSSRSDPEMFEPVPPDNSLNGATNGGTTTSKVGEFYVLAALYGETRCLISSLRGPTPVSVEYAVKRCDAIQGKLLRVLRNLGYDQYGRPVQRKALRYAVARQTKRFECTQLQASYHDAVLLLRKIVVRKVHIRIMLPLFH
jgi:hypothetical protein